MSCVLPPPTKSGISGRARAAPSGSTGWRASLESGGRVDLFPRHALTAGSALRIWAHNLSEHMADLPFRGTMWHTCSGDLRTLTD